LNVNGMNPRDLAQKSDLFGSYNFFRRASVSLLRQSAGGYGDDEDSFREESFSYSTHEPHEIMGAIMAGEKNIIKNIQNNSQNSSQNSNNNLHPSNLTKNGTLILPPITHQASISKNSADQELVNEDLYTLPLGSASKEAIIPALEKDGSVQDRRSSLALRDTSLFLRASTI